MTAIVPLLVPAALPPRAGHSGPLTAGARSLPLPRVVARRVRTTAYGLVTVDDRGRVADRTVVRALGWTDATRLELRADAGWVLVTATPDGRYGLAGRDRLLLPVHVRRSCGIEPGDRVVLAAEPADGVLTIHPLASLDAMLGALTGSTSRRDAA